MSTALHTYRGPAWSPFSAQGSRVRAEPIDGLWRGADGPASPSAEAPPRRPVVATPLLVAVVDDDESVRESLPDLLKELGYAVEAFSSAEQFLASGVARQTGCLILDVAMPGMSGPELQRELRNHDQAPPIVFITGRRDEDVRSRALENGAVEYLFKPFSEPALRSAIQAALRRR